MPQALLEATGSPAASAHLVAPGGAAVAMRDAPGSIAQPRPRETSPQPPAAMSRPTGNRTRYIVSPPRATAAWPGGARSTPGMDGDPDLNFSHGTHADHEASARNARRAGRGSDARWPHRGSAVDRRSGSAPEAPAELAAGTRSSSPARDGGGSNDLPGRADASACSRRATRSSHRSATSAPRRPPDRWRARTCEVVTGGIVRAAQRASTSPASRRRFRR